MLKIEVYAQKHYVVNRTRSYLTRLVASLVAPDGSDSSSSSSSADDGYVIDEHIFLVDVEDTGVAHFDGIVQPYHLANVPIGVGSRYRINTVDLYWPSKHLYDLGMSEIIKDVDQLVLGVTGVLPIIKVDGATV